MDHIKRAIKEDVKSIKKSDKIEKMIHQIIFSHLKDLVYVMKVEKGFCFRYLFANKIALSHAKIIDDYVGKCLQDVLPDKIAHHLQAKYEEVTRLRTPLSYQDKIILPNGQIVYGESILTPIFWEYKDIRYVVSVTRDITDRVNEKNKLIESQQRYKSLVDHNMDAIFSLDIKGKVLQTNPSTNLITGYTEKELFQCDINHLLDKADENLFFSIFKKTLEGSTSESVVCTMVHKNGHKIKTHLKTVPIFINNEIKGVYGIVRNITEQARTEEMIKFMAYHDYLTGLLNRSALKRNLAEDILKTEQSGNKLGLMYIDLDRFKFLNDTMGHNIGDILLRKVAERLMSIEDENYSVFRQGGDEFIVLLTHTNRNEINTYANKLVALFKPPFLLDNQEYYISVSIGISVFPNDGEDGETLIKNADTALYRVKERGKGHYQFYSTDMQQASPHTMRIETSLRKAIERNELMLYYQPQVNIYTGEISSVEALLRWNNPEHGFISPSEFVPLAEETGLILSIGEWVIEEVCKQLKIWTENGFKPIKVAINLSSKQFQQSNLADIIQHALEQNNVHPAFLEIEITEGAMQDTKETLFILNRLKKLGIQVSIDDFGTGYSSLSYLKRFPIDTLKIDQSFIRDVFIDKKDAAITTTIIHLAKSLGLNVIAEGVEKKEQEEFLKNVQCQKAQGYYYSKPLSKNNLEATFLSKKSSTNELVFNRNEPMYRP